MKYLAEVATLSPGDTFGEAALIDLRPRNATITLTDEEPGAMCMLTREDYKAIFHLKEKEILEDKLSQMDQIPIF